MKILEEGVREESDKKKENDRERWGEAEQFMHYCYMLRNIIGFRDKEKKKGNERI